MENQLIENIQNLFGDYYDFFFWLGIVSSVIFLVSLLSIGWLVSLIPSDYFINRVKYLAIKYKFEHNKISIKMMKSRWGSCSYKNNISINILIDYLPKKLQDYIILHELMHTKIKNHSKYFWSELEHVVNDLDSIRKELKENYIL